MEIDEVKKQIKAEMKKLSSLSRMLKGTINKIKTNRNRIKNSDKADLNKNWVYNLTYLGKNKKTKNVYINLKRVDEAKQMIANHKEALQILDNIVELNVKLFRLEKKRTKRVISQKLF